MDLLVNSTNVYSNNFFAEMLLKLIGAHHGAGGSHRPCGADPGRAQEAPPGQTLDVCRSSLAVPAGGHGGPPRLPPRA